MTDSTREDRSSSERMNAMIKAINGGAASAPTPDETDVHAERLRSYVSNISITALNEIGALREECDELIRSVHDQQESLLQHILAYSVMAKSLLESKNIMVEALNGINERFKSLPSLPHAPTLPGKGTH